ncbi:Mitochondrial carnitine/acylcarnitine carrier protein CACL [Harpegnathos saltator]|uniref:Mitochondrial carnitine/acylcarnitine carrier protein CACL n=1 Tax=Harpegnathos saltator TaxID=610380 RepID=E2C763_HARSA|nr:Mitochondrial carnitine/acylcarnitine carrier protein CACL [Harpegnathos saltator]
MPGSAGVVVGYPLDTVKVHMQTQDCRNPKYRGTWDCFRTILAKESPSEASTNKGTHGLASSKQPREGASKSYESFASKWNAFFDDISRGNGFAVSYYAASMLSISGLMPDNSACLVHNCRRTGCEHDALDALELREDTLASFESRGSKNDEEPEEEEEEKEDVDEQKQLEQPDWSNIESAINTCTCNLQRVLDVSKLCNT